MGSGRLRQPEQLGGGLAPKRIDQPRFQQRRSEPQGAGRCVITPPRGSEGRAALPAGLDNDAAGLAVAGNGLLPEDNSGTDFTGEDQAERAVLKDDQARLKAQRGVVAGTEIAARNAERGKSDGVFRRSSLAKRDAAVAIGIGGSGIADGAEAGNAQWQLLHPPKSGQRPVSENPPDRGEGGLAGMGHLDHSATGAESLSLRIQPVTAKGPDLFLSSAEGVRLGTVARDGRPIARRKARLSVPGHRE
jgi:hypothetical protein